MYSDAHCHLNGFSPQELQGALSRAKAASVSFILTTGTSLESSQQAAYLAETCEGVYAGVGIHPHQVQSIDKPLYQALRALAAKPKVVAISEIGLDYLRQPETAALQRSAFQIQLQLAKEMGLPVMIHSEGAGPDTFRIIQEEHIRGIINGAIHDFHGDAQAARNWLDMGFYVCVGRPLLDANAQALEEAVKVVPLDRLLTETDATPNARWPNGEGVEPADVVRVVERIARLKGLSTEEVGEATTANLKHY